MGRKIHVARLLQVDRIMGVYQKTEFCGLPFSKNLGFSSVPAGPLISDSFLVWKSYSSAEANFSQDILVQGGFYSIELVLA